MKFSSFIKRFRDITRNDAGINGDAQRIEQLVWMLFLKIYDDKEQEWEAMGIGYETILPQDCRWRYWASEMQADPRAVRKGDALLDFINNRLFPTLRDLPVSAESPFGQQIIKDVFADIHNYMKDGVLLRQCLQLIDECDFTDPEEAHAFGQIYEEILRQLQSAGSSGEFYTPRALTDFMAAHVRLRLGETVADMACGTGGFLNSARKWLEPQVKTVAQRRKLHGAFVGMEKKPLPYLLAVTNLLLNGVDDLHLTHGNSLSRNVSDYGPRDRFDVILMNPPYGGSEKAEIQHNFPARLRSAETADLFLVLITRRLKPTGRAAVVIPDGFLFGTGNKAEIKKELLENFNLHTIVRLPGSVFAPYTSIATNILFFDGPDCTDEAGRRVGSTRQTWFYRVDMPQGYKHFSKNKPMTLAHLDGLDLWWNDRKPISVDGVDKARAFTPEELAALDYNLDQCGQPKAEAEVLPPAELIARYKARRKACEERMDAALARILEHIGGQA